MNIYSSPFYPNNLRFDMWETQEKAAVPTYIDHDHCYDMGKDYQLKATPLEKTLGQQILETLKAR